MNWTWSPTFLNFTHKSKEKYIRDISSTRFGSLNSPVEELEHATPVALLELLVELQEVAHGVIVVLLEYPLQLHLDLTG